ncbi:MAG: hypothetical protein VX252_06640 [Myxococcota bacterium]|nr:hypothetical protein [Myxococcota bacterium]
MARRKRPKQQPNSAAQTLDALESRGDRMASWIAENPLPILAVGVGILVIAGLWGVFSQEDNQADLAAATQLSAAQNAYRSAMGADANSIDIPEPANAAAAQSIREEAVLNFDRVSADHPGTIAAALAQLQAGKLEQDLNNTQGARSHYEAGLEIVPPGNSLAAFFWIRMASLAEAQADWSQAAESYMRAASVPSYPLSNSARIDAIRSYLEAGNSQAALAVRDELTASAPDAPLPPHIAAQIAEYAPMSQTR